ncbi:PH domain-containing protein [Candidatus Woesearchaeota archaeon]|nr:PH domain-containing protein [Candidatus Woesearchaeota archaeon]
MAKIIFKVKPNIVAALFPNYIRWVWRFFCATIIVMIVLRFQSIVDYNEIWLASVLFPGIFVLSFFHVKHKIIRYHRTTYYFYENRFVSEFDLIIKRRQSIPYNQIRKLKHEQKLWQRAFHVADIRVMYQDEEGREDFILRAVKNPEDVEHKFYNLMKKQYHK